MVCFSLSESLEQVISISVFCRSDNSRMIVLFAGMADLARSTSSILLFNSSSAVIKLSFASVYSLLTCEISSSFRFKSVFNLPISLVSRLILKMFFEIFDNQLFVGHFLA